MSIKFFIPDYNNEVPKRASRRFRATIPLKGMRTKDGIIGDLSQATTNDIVVLAKKSKPNDVYYLKERNIKCVYDICDNKWRKTSATNWYQKIVIPHNEICKNADAIVTTCQSMRELILENVNRDSIIINDPYEADKLEPNINFKKKIIIFNFGNSKHFSRVDWNSFLDKMSNIDFELHCMLDRVKKFEVIYKQLLQRHKNLFLHEYDFDKQKEMIKNCDIVFLPIVTLSPDQALDVKVKSPNRIIDAIQSGKPVITNAGVESYKSFMPFTDFVNIDYEEYARAFLNLINRKKEFIHKRIIEGQNYIEQYHSPEVIGKQWIELENKV